ncbi:hypothetical protein [Horticoccus sp. 23ND18S-11]|uniref:hypothetical protein n=1 Tax=Horticoccus sp. 23ND18S-11 TaxID=3391832 RepID=UPI0039C9F548
MAKLRKKFSLRFHECTQRADRATLFSTQLRNERDLSSEISDKCWGQINYHLFADGFLIERP